MAANFQSPEMVAVVSSSLILSVMVLISFRMSSSSSFTGGDIEKVSSSVLGGDLQQGSSLQDVKMFLKYVEKKILAFYLDLQLTFQCFTVCYKYLL